jgi:hypothetical protein
MFASQIVETCASDILTSDIKSRTGGIVSPEIVGPFFFDFESPIGLLFSISKPNWLSGAASGYDALANYDTPCALARALVFQEFDLCAFFWHELMKRGHRPIFDILACYFGIELIGERRARPHSYLKHLQAILEIKIAFTG